MSERERALAAQPDFRHTARIAAERAAQAGLHTVQIGSANHLSATHEMIGGARTLCGITIAGTPVSPQAYSACAKCAIAAAYAAGDIATGQRLQREAGIAAGGSPESGGAVRS